jgi:signal transduction histidine kinase
MAASLHANDAESRADLFERLLSVMMESIFDPVTVIGANGETLFQNSASITALPHPPPKSFADWDAAFALHSPDGVRRLPLSEWPLARALAGESFDALETSAIMPNDPTEPTMLLATGKPFRRADGTIEGAVLISRDITAMRRTEKELANAQRMDAIGQLTGGVAHDFNNILTAITSSAHVLMRHHDADTMIGRLARNIDQAATRGADLVRHLLAFARAQPLNPTRTDVNALIEETIMLLRATLSDQITIETDLAPALPAALVDPTQLTTALLNLAVNARDAMPDGGTLTFRTRSEGEQLAIAVSDTGEGIPFDVQNKVFEPYFTTKPVGKGTGLGLSMAYGFVTQSGGSIELHSAPGAGAAFTIRLPTTDAAAAAPQPEAHPAPAAPARILVVEDNPLVRDALRLELEDMGYDIFVAADGPEALALLEGGLKIDLMLTDVIMPGGMNGRELAEKVVARDPAIKILYASGHPRDVLILEGRIAGNFPLLRKPFQPRELADALRRALNRS